jgi:predicted CoA-binding protein
VREDISQADLAATLRRVKNLAIVGVSNNPERASFQVAKYLKDHSDYNLFFVNPNLDSIFGEKVYSSLKEIPASIDLVDIFRKPQDVLPILFEAIEIKAKVFWMQLGIKNAEATAQGVAAGIVVIEDRCIKIDYQELIVAKSGQAD